MLACRAASLPGLQLAPNHQSSKQACMQAPSGQPPDLLLAWQVLWIRCQQTFSKGPGLGITAPLTLWPASRAAASLPSLLDPIQRARAWYHSSPNLLASQQPLLACHASNLRCLQASNKPKAWSHSSPNILASQQPLPACQASSLRCLQASNRAKAWGLRYPNPLASQQLTILNITPGSGS